MHFGKERLITYTLDCECVSVTHTFSLLVYVFVRVSGFIERLFCECMGESAECLMNERVQETCCNAFDCRQLRRREQLSVF